MPDTTIRAGRRNVRISNPDKVLFPDDGITKLDLAHYYEAVSRAMVEHTRDRPLNLWRWNNGIDKDVVVQQAIPKGAPEWVRRVPVPRRRGGAARLARQPDLHPAARLDRARRQARQPGPAGVRLRPARRRRRALRGDPGR